MPDVPPALLRSDGLYQLPPALVRVYRNELSTRSLLEKAQTGTPEKGVHGGESLEETNEHFAYRFQTSAIRPQHLLLSRTKEFLQIQIDLLSTLSSHRVAVLDLGCGAGAGTLALLSVIAELRAANKVPSLPLEVDVLGADFSSTALNIFSSMCSGIGGELAERAITLTHRATHWEADRSESTSALCDLWLQLDASEYLILINNFGGQGSAMVESLEHSLRHVGDRVSSKAPTKVATWTWLEHGGGKTGAVFLRKIIAFFGRSMARVFARHHTAPSETFEWFDSITSNQVSSSVMVHHRRRAQP